MAFDRISLYNQAPPVCLEKLQSQVAVELSLSLGPAHLDSQQAVEEVGP